MSRLARLSIKDCLHYCILRGKEKLSLFKKLSDLEVAFEYFEVLSQRYHVEISGYALLPTQVHLLLNPKHDANDLSNFMKVFSRLYTDHYCLSHEHKGTIWHGRFSSAVLQLPNAILPALLYLEYLPQVQDVRDATLYQWTSYPHHVGLRNDAFMMPISDYWNLGNTPYERQDAYRKLFARGCSWVFGERLIQKVHRGWPIAEKEFLEAHNVNPKRMGPRDQQGNPLVRNSLPTFYPPS